MHSILISFSCQELCHGDVLALDKSLCDDASMSNGGEYDGYDADVDGSSATLYFYTDDVDGYFERIRPRLLAIPFLQGATVSITMEADEEDDEEYVRSFDL